MIEGLYRKEECDRVEKSRDKRLTISDKWESSFSVLEKQQKDLIKILEEATDSNSEALQRQFKSLDKVMKLLNKSRDQTHEAREDSFELRIALEETLRIVQEYQKKNQEIIKE